MGRELGCTLPMLIVVVSVSGIGQLWSHAIVQTLFWKVINCDPVNRAFWFYWTEQNAVNAKSLTDILILGSIY